jgi:hypothetical protein
MKRLTLSLVGLAIVLVAAGRTTLLLRARNGR